MLLKVLMVLGWTKKSKFYHIHIIAFHGDNDLKLKFVREKQVDILTKKANDFNSDSDMDILLGMGELQ